MIGINSQRSKQLKNLKEEFKAESSAITDNLQQKVNSLKVDRDMEEILKMYYDTNEYKEFQIIFDKRFKAKVLGYLNSNQIEYFEISEDRVLVKCQT